MDGPVRLEQRGGAAILTLARPAEGNKMSLAMVRALHEAARNLADRDDLRALLIRAEGRHFCVGGAIDEFTAGGDLRSYLTAVLSSGNQAVLALTGLTCPIVTAIQGPAAGAGIALALLGDIVVAGQSAAIRAGYPALGLTADLGVTAFLDHLAGPRAAADILLSNRSVGAAEALSMRLFSEVVADADLIRHAEELVDRLAAGPTRAHAAIKGLLDGGFRERLAERLAAEEVSMLAAADSLDAREGIAAFLARRAPNFTGR